MNKKMGDEWLKSASADLMLIKEIKSNELLTQLASFHAQQAVEKCLKAVLEYNDQPVPKKHDLLYLKNIASPFILIQNDDILDSLNKLYIESRYPGESGLLPDGIPGLDDVDEFFTFATNVFNQVQKILI